MNAIPPLSSNERRPAREIASRAARVAPFLAMDVMSAARLKERGGDHVVHMEVGQPSAATPRRVREAVHAALDRGHIPYTDALGRPSLRERIARHYRDTYGVEVPAERIAVTTGSSGGFVIAFLTLFEPGARVAISAPGYACYRNIFTALGIEAVPVEVSDADRWTLTGAAIERAHAECPLAGVLAMSPANPTGTMIGKAELAALTATCRRLGLWFVSDEIYHGLTYVGPAETALAFDDEAIVVNSFSKYYGMTGWRIGWLVVPERLARAIERLAQNLFISPPFLSQIGAEAAFEATEELEAIKAGYARNRELLLTELPALGLEGPPIDGAFYAYVDVSRYSNDSAAFCRKLLDEAGVAATPGLDFEGERGARYMRMSFAGSTEDCAEAVRRIRAWLGRG